MEPTYEANVPQAGLDEDQGRFAAAKDAVKTKLGQVGRKLKRIDARGAIVDHPFAAIGIAAGVGAIIGLARPAPERSRLGGLLMAGISAIGMRFIREAALEHVRGMAKDWLLGQNQQQNQTEAEPARTY